MNACASLPAKPVKQERTTLSPYLTARALYMHQRGKSATFIASRLRCTPEVAANAVAAAVEAERHGEVGR